MARVNRSGIAERPCCGRKSLSGTRLYLHNVFYKYWPTSIMWDQRQTTTCWPRGKYTWNYGRRLNERWAHYKRLTDMSIEELTWHWFVVNMSTWLYCTMLNVRYTPASVLKLVQSCCRGEWYLLCRHDNNTLTIRWQWLRQLRDDCYSHTVINNSIIKENTVPVSTTHAT